MNMVNSMKLKVIIKSIILDIINEGRLSPPVLIFV